MKRQKWVIAALALVLALVAGACGDEQNPAVDPGDDTTPTTAAGPPQFAAGSTMDALQKKGKIVVGTKFDQPLFGLKNPITEKPEGFDVEIAKLMAVGIFGGDLKSVESKVEFVETVSQQREPSIIEGKVDLVIATYTINPARKQTVDFAGPYIVADQDIMVRSDETSIKTVADLAGKKVCSVTGSTSLKNIQAQAPKADYSITFDKYSLCAEAMADKRVDAVTTDNLILAGIVNDNPGKFKLLAQDLSDEPYGIGLKKGDEAFRNFLNDRLEEIFENGDWKAAYQATIGKVIQEVPQTPTLDRYTGGGAAGATSTTPAGGSATTNPTTTTSTTAKP